MTALAPRPAADGALAARDTDGDSPFDGAGAPDYAATDNGKPADGGDAGWAVGAGGSYQGYRGRAPRVTNDEAGAYDEGIDFKASFTPTDWLQSFYIRRLALREDGLPVPFTPVDSVQTATVHIGSRDKVEARHWYCSLAWRQQSGNPSSSAKGGTGQTSCLPPLALRGPSTSSKRSVVADGEAASPCRSTSVTQSSSGPCSATMVKDSS